MKYTKPVAELEDFKAVTVFTLSGDTVTEEEEI